MSFGKTNLAPRHTECQNAGIRLLTQSHAVSWMSFGLMFT